MTTDHATARAVFADLYRARFAQLVDETFYRHAPLSREEAEDIVQDVFFRLLRATSLPARAAPVTYVRRAIANRVVDHFRHQSLHPVQTLHAWHLLDDTTDGPEEQLLADEAVATVRAAVVHLPAEPRWLIIGHYLNDRPLPDLAAERGTAPNTVKQALLRARRALARMPEVQALARAPFTPSSPIGPVTAQDRGSRGGPPHA